MASRFFRSCSAVTRKSAPGIVLLAASIPAFSQLLLKPSQPGEHVTLLPSDVAIFEEEQPRADIPCTVTPRKAELGFDLRFHSGFDVNVPMRELAGSGEVLTVVFRVFSAGDSEHSANFVQHFHVPTIEEEAKGDALLQGGIDLGEGNYHVDWLMRDRAERICSTSWDVTAELTPKDKPMPLFLGARQIAETPPQPFLNDASDVLNHTSGDNLAIKLLVNFAPQNSASAALQRSDTEALVSILKTIERDPRVSRISLVAFNMEESRIVYRQDTSGAIDFPALGKALEGMKLGTVNVQQLSQKHSETDFLEDLITREVGNAGHPDAVVFAGPKAMLNADVPESELRRIGDIECPVFYMNYNLSPQAVPWKDSISRAIRTFKGTEYTISRPRDLWFSTSEMVSRIVRHKRDKALAVAAGGGSR
jgi:hypothetical protein